MIRCHGAIHYATSNDVIFLYLYPIFGLIAFVGNLLVIIAIINNPVLRTKSNFLVATLAVTDLLVGAIIAPLTTVLIYFQKAIPCSVIITNNFVTTQLCASSVFLLAVISIDRYYHFAKLHAYYIFMSKKRIATFIVMSFTLAGISAFLFITRISLLLYHVIVTIFFAIPVNIIVICYWKILKIVRMKTKDLAEARISRSRVEVQSVHEMHVHDARIVAKRVDTDSNVQRVQAIKPREWPRSNREENERQYEDENINVIKSKVCEEGKSDRSSRIWKDTTMSMRFEEMHYHERRASNTRVYAREKRLTAMTECGLSIKNNRVDGAGTAKEVVQQGMADLIRRPRKGVSQKQQLNLKTSRNWKVAKMMFIIVVVFSICWSPYVVFSLFHAARIHQGESERKDTIVYKWTLFLGFLNSSINPFIYCIRQRAIREGIMVVFRKLCNVILIP